MTTGTKALIGALLAGTVGLVIFLFVHFGNTPGDPIKIGASKAGACPHGQRDCLPDVSYIDTNGVAYTPKSLTGKVVVVNFWATWCGPCRKEIPDLSRVYDKYKDKGLVIIGVLTDDPSNQELLNFASDHEMSYPIVRASSDILISYDYPRNLPTTFVFDRSGRMVDSHVGPLKADQFSRDLDPLLAAK